MSTLLLFQLKQSYARRSIALYPYLAQDPHTPLQSLDVWCKVHIKWKSVIIFMF